MEEIAKEASQRNKNSGLQQSKVWSLSVLAQSEHVGWLLFFNSSMVYGG